MNSAGVVLAGGQSSRMGTSKAALEWHGSTLLRWTVQTVARATSGPVVVVRAAGQELPELPEGVLVADDPREGKGPLQGIAAGLAALTGRADIAFVSSTDMPFLHPAFIRRVLGVLEESEETDIALPVAREYKQPLAAGYRVSLAGIAERLVAADRLRPAFLFEQCRVRMLDDAELLRDPVLAALDPDLDSVLNVNTPADYAAARARDLRLGSPVVGSKALCAPGLFSGSSPGPTSAVWALRPTAASSGRPGRAPPITWSSRSARTARWAAARTCS